MTVTSTADRWARRLRGTLILLALASAALASAALATAGAATAATPALPTGDPFYRYSRPLAHIAPGTVLRSRRIALVGSSSSNPVTAAQVLYRTTGELGQPTVTVATVILPAAPAAKPTKLVSYQTAYDALGAQCDPSYSLAGGAGDAIARFQETYFLSYVKSGYAVVVSDYEGENLDWDAGQESGYGTLDGILAAEHYLHMRPKSTPVGMEGYSGGSIATEWAAELQPAYAPSLHVVAAAAGGVPVDFFHNLAYINGSPVWSGVIPASIVGTSRSVGLKLGPALSAYGLKVTRQVAHECINSFLGAYPGLTVQKLFQRRYSNVLKLPSFVALSDHLIMGSGTPKAPIFLAVGNSDGTGDGVMVARDVQQLAYQYCRRGVSVQFAEYTGKDHYLAALAFEPAANAYLQQALSGKRVTNGCASIHRGNSLAPVPIPRSSVLGFRWLGRRVALGGLAVEVWVPHGTQRNVAVILQLRGRVVARVHLAKLGTRRQILVLRARGQMPKPGLYTVTVNVRGGSLIWEEERVG